MVLGGCGWCYLFIGENKALESIIINLRLSVKIRSSLAADKETLISHSLRADNLWITLRSIIKIVVLQGKLNSQPQQVSCANIKALAWKQWGPEAQDRKI